jgi:hypothetical protein
MALGSPQPLIEISGRCVWQITLPPSCADYLDILGPSTSWNSRGLSRPVKGLLFFNMILPRNQRVTNECSDVNYSKSGSNASDWWIIYQSQGTHLGRGGTNTEACLSHF